MFDYLRSNCDIGCKTVWSEVLLCIKEYPHSSFYKEFHRSDVIYVCAMSFMMSLVSHDPHSVIFGTKYTGFPTKRGYNLNFSGISLFKLVTHIYTHLYT